MPRGGFSPALFRGGAFFEEPGLVCEDDRLDAVAEAELLQDVRDVCLDGRLADVEPLPDLCVDRPSASGSPAPPRARSGRWRAGRPS
jgi:hypothetical protein